MVRLDSRPVIQLLLDAKLVKSLQISSVMLNGIGRNPFFVLQVIKKSFYCRIINNRLSSLCHA